LGIAGGKIRQEKKWARPIVASPNSNEINPKKRI
jgi:hypothetical protein